MLQTSFFFGGGFWGKRELGAGVTPPGRSPGARGAQILSGPGGSGGAPCPPRPLLIQTFLCHRGGRRLVPGGLHRAGQHVLVDGVVWGGAGRVLGAAGLGVTPPRHSTVAGTARGHSGGPSGCPQPREVPGVSPNEWVGVRAWEYVGRVGMGVFGGAGGLGGIGAWAGYRGRWAPGYGVGTGAFGSGAG